MKKQMILALPLLAAIMAIGCKGNNTKQFQSEDGTVKATAKGDHWVITDSTGHELVENYDSMRVVEVGDDGHPMTIVYYTGDEQRHIQYYSTMNLRSDGVIKAGLREGRWVFYHPNGLPQVEATFLNGKEEGAYKVYRENGVPLYIGQYADGKPVGIWEVYDREGNLVQKTEY